jgi:hypothetical protein
MIALYALLLVVSAQPEPSSTTLPTTVAVEPASDVRTRKLQGWVADLVAVQPGVAEEAIIQLAHAGLPALDVMEQSAASAGGTLRNQMRSVLSLMLLRTVTVDDVSRRPGLSALVRTDLAAAEKLAEKFERVEVIIAEGGNTVNGPIPIINYPDEPQWSKQLADCGGFAAAAVVKMCRSTNATARACGVRLIARLVMTPQLGLLRMLEKDAGSAKLFYGCYHQRRTVGEIVNEAMKSELRFSAVEVGPSLVDRRVSHEGSLYIRQALALEQRWGDPGIVVLNLNWMDATVLEAKTWDEFWERARPRFREMVAKGPTAKVPDRILWRQPKDLAEPVTK